MPSTVTIKKDGTGDYTTIASAIPSSLSSGDGVYTAKIQDSSLYTERVVIWTSGTSSSDYVKLTVAASHQHGGGPFKYYNDSTPGHAQARGTTSGAMSIGSDYAMVEGLDIVGYGTYGSYIGATHVVISRCIIRSSDNYNGGSVQFVDDGGTLSVDNSILYNGTMSFDVTTYGAQTINIDHCLLVDNGAYAIQAGKGSGATSCTFNINNSVLQSNRPNYSNLYSGWSSGESFSFTGSSNCWDLDEANMVSSFNNLSNSQNISSGGVTTSTTTANAYIHKTTSYPNDQDYTPRAATGSGSNLALGNGTNRQGSEPDSRQDFSTDIANNSRTNKAGYIDIGAFQITEAPASFKYWNGSDFVDVTAVQYYNGSAWVDVTGVQYWNGSAWTDPS